ncbi:Phosphate/sulphate permease-like protein [Vulcanisaeta moutnovskia 768-28]|uniref:Phosphate/sulphate permease-like protein n=1 Tax=Vulcanisaeta moutnovskia (strain 768-28) TaxID=985053 RepID=F0QW09_VULM7|nr:inorganic phosphate transporter [Vulcanisaeta moutnovskia]ADY00933.1 Phosphate/sulphate permease-like protein [Vulcanisaeta moutnovskia 768-28]
MTYTLIVNYALAFLLSFLVSGNNLSANAGAAVGSRSIDYKYALVIALLGYVLGLWLQGTYMKSNIVSGDVALVAMAVAIVIFIIGEGMKVPMSLTGSLYASLVGASFALGHIMSNAVFVLSYWLSLPIIVMFLSYILYKFLSAFSRISFRHIGIYRALSILTVFLLSFSFGANNLGLLWALLGFSYRGLLLIIISSMMGVLLIGWRTLYRLSTGLFTIGPLTSFTVQLFSFIAMEIGTLYSVPMPVTVTTSFGLVGVGAAHRFRIINLRYFNELILGFIASIIVGLIFSYLLIKVI